MRDLSTTEAKNLRAGDGHYTAFVGPPQQYDFMGATQFRLLCALGLRGHHRVLDFGCGSLRAGRLLIPYLEPERYFGIEPNAWLVEDAIANQIGRDMVRLKRPSFSNSDAFDAGVFSTRFDFIVAQSIFSHAGPQLVKHALSSFAAALEPDGICAVTFVVREEQDAPEGWHYPHCIAYSPAGISALVDEAGLVHLPIPWFHPRQSWFLLARNSSALPTAKQARLLRGIVLRAPDFRDSIKKSRSEPA
jgi:SAM-dependent methyltransferase